MVADLTLIAMMLVRCIGIGWAWHRLFDRSGRYAVLMPISGLAVAVVFATVAYLSGISVRCIHLTTWAVGLLGFLMLLIRAFRTWKSGQIRIVFTSVVLFVGVLAAGMAPKWVGGNSFAAFQGNVIDTLNYASSASAVSHYGADHFTGLKNKDRLADPQVNIAASTMTIRPAVHIFYAVSAQAAPGSLWILYYAYLTVLMTFCGLALVFFLRRLFHLTLMRSALVAAAFVLGFWGQYVFDINSWSQIASQPLIIALIGMIFYNYPRRTNLAVPDLAMIALYSAGCLYLYPENVVLSGTAAAAALVVLYAVYRRHAFFWAIAAAVFVGMFSGFFNNLIHFAYSQLRIVTSDNVDWWLHFQSFLTGRDGIGPISDIKAVSPKMLFVGAPFSDLFAHAVDLLASVSGLYLLTPPPGMPLYGKLIVRTLLLTFLVVLFLGSALAWRRHFQSTGGRRSAILMLVLLGTGGAAGLFLVMKGNYWAAGKALSYFSPFLVLTLAYPLLTGRRGLGSFLSWPALLFVCLSVGFGLVRIVGASDRDGAPYARPYPISLREMKIQYDFDFSRYDEALSGCRSVQIEVKEAYFEEFAILYLSSHGVRYGTDRIVNTYHGYPGRDIGHMPKLPAPDCILTEKELKKPGG